jgi:hypothetical protein
MDRAKKVCFVRVSDDDRICTIHSTVVVTREWWMERAAYIKIFINFFE